MRILKSIALTATIAVVIASCSAPKGIISVGNPSFTESIVIHANGKKKFVSYYTGYTNDLNDQKAKPFLDLYKMIWDILYKKKEIIALPESDQYYELDTYIQIT